MVTECINEAVKYESDVLTYDNVPIYCHDLYTLSNSVNTNSTLEKLLQNSNNANQILTDYLGKKKR